jgi:type II secretory pathway pseudopilin PulG
MIAILAAAVVPVVVGQLQKSDVGRIESDLVAMRGGIEQFVSDVRKYPASVGQLTSPISASMTILKSLSTFSVSDAGHWQGPYLSKDSLAERYTAYDDSIIDLFDTTTVLETSNAKPGAGLGTKYMIVEVLGVDTTTALTLDQLYDDGNTGTGFIRWINGGTLATDTLKFLAMPWQ